MIRRVLATTAALLALAAGVPSAGAVPRPSTVVGTHWCRAEIRPPFNGFTSMWSDVHVECDVPVAIVMRVDFVSSYLIPDGTGDRVVGSSIDSAFGTSADFTARTACRWTATRFGGFYFARLTILVVYQGSYDVGVGRTEALPLPCRAPGNPAFS